MNKYLILIVILVIGAGGFFIWQSQSVQKPAETKSPINQQTNTSTQSATTQFSNPKKSAHYESNTPSHGATLAGVPINVVIDFNFDLAENSRIEIHYFGSIPKIGPNDLGAGETIIDKNKLSMRRNMDPTSPDGRYSVVYKACWPDGSCHDGSFEFAINRELAKNFTDETKSSEVTVKLSQIQFQPQNIRIKKGTKVTWVNGDSIEHYINTDSHPAHTYFLNQNSRALQKGDTYSVTFDTAGIYPYHCSAHADSMTGNILVE